MEAKFRQVIRGFAPVVIMLVIESILVTFGAPAVVYSGVCAVLFALWYFKIHSKPSRDHFVGYRLWVIPGVLMLAMALQYLTGYITEVVSLAMPQWSAEYAILLDEAGFAGDDVTLDMLLYVILLAPITEELCFRGLTYTYLRRGISMYAAVVVQALMFAGMHANYYQATYTLVFGLFMGYVYAKSENIYLTIALHIGYNLIAMFASGWIYLGENPISFYCILLTTMVACYISLMLVIRSIPQMVAKKPE